MVLNVKKDLVNFELSKYKMILDNQNKQQDKKDLSENKNPFGTLNFISLNNKEVNKANLQEMAKLISQKKEAKAVNEDKNEKLDASEKSTLKTTAGIVGKEALYRLTSSSIFKGNPAMIIASLLGVDPEEDGNAFKKGAVTGEGGDFEGDYKKFFKGFEERAFQSYGNAFLEGLNLIPNLVSVGLTNCLKYAGAGLSKVFGKDFTSLVGSGISAIGKGINAIGDTVGTYLKGLYESYKNLFTGNMDGVKKSVNDMVNKFKNIAGSVKDKVVEVAKDAKDFVVNTAEKVGNGIKKGFDKVKNFFSSLF